MLDIGNVGAFGGGNDGFGRDWATAGSAKSASAAKRIADPLRTLNNARNRAITSAAANRDMGPPARPGATNHTRTQTRRKRYGEHHCSSTRCKAFDSA